MKLSNKKHNFSVRNYVVEMQLNGQLLDLTWRKCDFCKDQQPFKENTCIVCDLRKIDSDLCGGER